MVKDERMAGFPRTYEARPFERRATRVAVVSGHTVVKLGSTKPEVCEERRGLGRGSLQQAEGHAKL